MVLVYGLIAILIGIPLATLTARLLMTELIEGLINIRSDSYALPLVIIVVQVAIGLLLPVLAGLVPVLKGTQITTRQALNDVGMGSGTQGNGIIDRLLTSIQKIVSMQRPLMLAARNTLRHKGRLIQTLIVLIMGTALFISVLSVRSSVNKTLEDFLHYHQYDVSVGFEEPQRLSAVSRIAQDVPGVVDFEGWSVAGAVRVRSDESESNTLRLYALPADSQYVDPKIEGGRWLVSDDQNAVVVNSEFVDDEQDIVVGSQLELDIDGRDTIWQVVGIVQTDAQGPSVYVSDKEYGRLMRQPGQVTHIQVSSDQHEGNYQSAIEANLINQYEENDFRVRESRTSQTLNSQNELMFDIIVAVLIMMALLLAAVGGLGLTTTMSINILERIREIGVLRAIGASNTSVRQIVLTEGVFIGVISWTIGLLLSIPLSTLMSEQVGLALLGIPLSFDYAIVGAVGWFFGLLFVAIVASLGPAKDAVSLTIREVLAYE
jgi:putative ABC transport system permease protein